MGTDHRGTPVGKPHTSTPLVEGVSRLRGTLAKHLDTLSSSEAEPKSRLRGTLGDGTPISSLSVGPPATGPDVPPAPKNETVVRTIPGTRIRTTMPEPK